MLCTHDAHFAWVIGLQNCVRLVTQSHPAAIQKTTAKCSIARACDLTPPARALHVCCDAVLRMESFAQMQLAGGLRSQSFLNYIALAFFSPCFKLRSCREDRFCLQLLMLV